MILKALTLTLGFTTLNVALWLPATRANAILPQQSLASIDSLPSGRSKCFCLANGTKYIVPFGAFDLDDSGQLSDVQPTDW